MKISNPKNLLNKDLVVFDLDGTLAKTKSPMDKEMGNLIVKLLSQKKVAVIGGGKYQLFEYQLLEPLKKLKYPRKLLKNLYLFPATSTSFYRYNKGWQKVYAHLLPKSTAEKITKAFHEVFTEIGYQHPKKTYGPIIEYRGTQVTFSALGQEVVAILGRAKGVALKDKWKKENTPLKLKIAKLVQKKLPELEVHAAGHTSIDVTKKGIDKAYGVRQINKYLKIPISKMVFIGDAIFPGGNDYAALKSGIEYVAVDEPEETKKIIRKILK